MIFFISLFWQLFFSDLYSNGNTAACPVNSLNDSLPYVQILGTTQDGGYPHMGCQKQCCTKAWKDAGLKRYIVSLAIVDPASKKWWLVEATPDIKEQLEYFKALTNGRYPLLPEGILITHAHIGHYTGLAQFGREVMNTKEIPVYVLPKMKTFLEMNGPWSQLVNLKNISLMPLRTDAATKLSGGIMIETFTVPHRDEYSETAGFRILTPGKKYLFIPDIDKWEKWDRKISEEVEGVDYALLDATFFTADELPNRKIEEVPHPLVQESMALLKKKELSSKIVFIHFNHTNPLLWDAAVQKLVKKQGFGIAEQGQKLN